MTAVKVSDLQYSFSNHILALAQALIESSIESNRTKVPALCKIILQFDCGLVVEMEHCIYKKPRFKLQ